ncbi:MAG: Alkaline phosphatase [Ramlibacter sp.]|jgi:alkaline phosphatase D|uniref:alkaline phosphatase D family protein n=1 Tax=Ramlibacter sp. TaxID=1917967 RepID=UPI0026308A5E|nr:alkaline phosphatase D family protein [Ramlibacter sp.]MDB5749820.1 Alkaline phosphatase [Ramlibacter sp.]
MPPIPQSPDPATRLAADTIRRHANVSRRSLVRGAILMAMGITGASLTACGGGGGSSEAGAEGDNPLVAGAEQAEGVFMHGVASGDPLADRVILWTHVSAAAPGVLSLQWELALDRNFGVRVSDGTASTGPDQDYTVKIDVTGLEPGTTYYYRFRFAGEVSNVGLTRTLPGSAIRKLRLGVFSCANFPAGYFNAYGHAARRDDIDFALHLGDYIYEFGVLGYASQLAIAIDRVSRPDHVILTLDDYRKRHAQYKTDPDLRALHASVPMIAVWDDHDVADNTWREGAVDHDPAGDGSFAARRAAAVQAYQEWLPIRVPDPSNPLKIYRSFDFGNLASLHVLDTRLIGRDEQHSMDQFLDGQSQGTDRQLLGVEQSAWLTGQMTRSKASWQVLGQQVLMARMLIPLSVASAFNLQTLGEFLLAQATPEALRSDRQRELMQQERVPYNLDAWDGYPAARESVLATADSLNKNLVSLAGDTHNAWASDLTLAAGKVVGVEFATASVSSPGFERFFPLISSAVLEDAFPKMVPDLRYAETSSRGYLLLTLTPSEARGDWVHVDTVLSRSNYSAEVAMSLRSRAGKQEIVDV